MVIFVHVFCEKVKQNVGENWTFSQLICLLLSNELSGRTKKKKSSNQAGCGIESCLVKHKSSLIEQCGLEITALLCPSNMWLKRGQVGHHNQLRAFKYVYKRNWSPSLGRKKNKMMVLESERGDIQ